MAAEDFERAQELRDRLAALQSELEEARQGCRPVAEVTAEDIAVSRATGIPVSQLTKKSVSGSRAWKSSCTSGSSARKKPSRP